MRGGSRKCTFTRYCKWWIALKRILLPTMYILLPNYTNFENIRAIWKFGVCNHVNYGKICLIARTSLPFLVARGLLGGVTKVKDVCEEDSEAPGMELLLAGENDCLVPTPIGTGDPCLGTGDPCLGEPPRGEPEKYSFLFCSFLFFHFFEGNNSMSPNISNRMLLCTILVYTIWANGIFCHVPYYGNQKVPQ